MIKLRKLLASLMIVCMAFSLMPLAAFATEGEAEETIVCEHPSLVDGVCTVCGKTVVQEQSDTQDDNGTAGENGGGAAGGSTEGGGTTGGNGTAGEGGSGTNGGGTTGGNGTTGDGGSGEGENGVTADAVAKIGETGYETLAAALAAMQDGDTVTLLKDV